MATSSQQSAGLGLIIGGSIVAAGGVAFLGVFVSNLRAYQAWMAARDKQNQDETMKDLGKQGEAPSAEAVRFANQYLAPKSGVIDTTGALEDFNETSNITIAHEKFGLLINNLADPTFDPTSASYDQLDGLNRGLSSPESHLTPSVKKVWASKIQQIGVNRTAAEIANLPTTNPGRSIAVENLLISLASVPPSEPQLFREDQIEALRVIIEGLPNTSTNPTVNKATLLDRLSGIYDGSPTARAPAPTAPPIEASPEKQVENPIAVTKKNYGKIAVASGIIGALLGAAGGAMIGVGASMQNGSLGLADGTCASSATLACYINNVGAIALQASKP